MRSKTTPVYSIGVAAELLSVHPRTLRIYEEAGLLKPARRNKRRLYSDHDVEWARVIRFLLHSRGLNQEGLRRLLALMPCWEIKGCPGLVAAACPARSERMQPCWRQPADCSEGPDGCHKCPVYLAAPDFLCSRDERQEIEHAGDGGPGPVVESVPEIRDTGGKTAA